MNFYLKNSEQFKITSLLATKKLLFEGAKMNSYHGLQFTKDKYVERMRAHISADNLIRGTGWEDGKGCAVGCTLERYDHSAYPSELGLPVWLAHLSDKIFEGCSLEYSKTFPLRLLESIPVGVDVSDVWRPLAIMRHERQIKRLQSNNESYAIDCKSAIQQVVDYLKNPSESARVAAESAVWATREAAWSAWSAEKAAWAAAWSSAHSAASAAHSAAAAAPAAWVALSAAAAAHSAAAAAHSAAAATAWSAAWASEYEIEGENLIKLLSGFFRSSGQWR